METFVRPARHRSNGVDKSREWMKVRVALTPPLGKGLVALKDLDKHEEIFVVQGRVVSDTYGPDYGVGPAWLAIGHARWLAPLHSNPWRFINHSCRPSAGLRGRNRVIALRPIARGEHITIDYATTEADPFWRMPCRCGARECRRVIGGVLSLPAEVFKKYQTIIPAALRQFRARALHPALSLRGRKKD